MNECMNGRLFLHSFEYTLISGTPLTWIVGPKSKHNITIVGHSDRVLCRRQIVLSVQQTASVQVQSVLQVDLLHIGVRRSANTDHIECVAVQMERMAEIRLLNCK